jgi:hypothetical protein
VVGLRTQRRDRPSLIARSHELAPVKPDASTQQLSITSRRRPSEKRHRRGVFLAGLFERVRADQSIAGAHVQMTWRVLLGNAERCSGARAKTRWKKISMRCHAFCQFRNHECERDHIFVGLDQRRCRLAAVFIVSQSSAVRHARWRVDRDARGSMSIQSARRAGKRTRRRCDCSW